MPKVVAFHSVTQANKPEAYRIHHDNDRCFSGRDISLYERLDGDGGYRLCVECRRLSSLQAGVVDGNVVKR